LTCFHYSIPSFPPTHPLFFLILLLLLLLLLLPLQGHIVTHASNVLHGGHPITSGRRYILVAFVIVYGYQNFAMRFADLVWNY